ncbi:MAG: lysylphosphatidylglycerol synthase transmembrane domain-containing protein [Chloroflexota bacterium]|jgi:uncharacterized protein (TIRG00374 family)
MLKRWQFWVGIAVSAVFLYFALRGLRLAEVWEDMQSANLIWLLPGVAVYFIGVWVRTWRWHYLLRPLKKIPTRTMFPIVAIGYMGNNIFPARAGEVLRAAILKDREGVAISASLATVVVERIFDAVVILGFVFFNLGNLSRLTDDAGFVATLQQLALWSAAVFIGALVVFLLAAMFPRVTERLAMSLIKRVIPARFRDKISGLALRFLSGLESLRSPQDVLMVFFITIIIWLVETSMYWFIMHGFGFEVSFFVLILMNGVANIATTLPSAPGYVGTFHAPGIAVLVAFGVPQVTAAAYTLVLHATLWLPITVLGVYYYFKQPLRWGKNLENLRGAQENISA